MGLRSFGFTDSCLGFGGVERARRRALSRRRSVSFSVEWLSVAIVRYPSAERCIYCGETDKLLSDEHILPFALGGNHVIPRASCPSCAKITAKVENFCMRSMFGPARILLGLPTRRPKQRPKTLPITLVMPDGKDRTIDVPAEEHPISFGVIEFPPAKIIRGLPPDERATLQVVPHARFLSDEKMNRLLQKHGAIRVTINLMVFETLQFAQFLAKIAHCWAFANIPQDYQPLATDLILGRIRDPNYLVGCGIHLVSHPDEKPAPDGLSFGLVTAVDERGRIAVLISFFSDVFFPRFHVVVGQKH